MEKDLSLKLSSDQLEFVLQGHGTLTVFLTFIPGVLSELLLFRWALLLF